ncbi:MAG: GNAT family N-acetyltransferase [Bacteroidota bacterium]
MNKSALSPFPFLETARLRLRQLKPSDAPTIYSFHADSENRKYIDKPPPENVLATRNFIKSINAGISKNECGYWGLELKADPQLVGTICLWNFSENFNRVEVGFELGAQFQRLGYMSEALESVIYFAFNNLKASKIEAYTHLENRSSQKILEKYNFKKEKEIEEKFAEKKGTYKMAVYSLKNP